MGNKKMSVFVQTKLKMIFSLFIFISDWVLSRLFDWLIGGVLLDLPIQSSTSVGELTFFAASRPLSPSTPCHPFLLCSTVTSALLGRAIIDSPTRSQMYQAQVWAFLLNIVPSTRRVRFLTGATRMTRQIVWDFNRVTSCIIMGNFASKTQEKEAIWIVVHHVVVDGREVIGTMVRNESKWFWTSYVLDRDICAPLTIHLLQTFCLCVVIAISC